MAHSMSRATFFKGGSFEGAEGSDFTCRAKDSGDNSAE